MSHLNLPPLFLSTSTHASQHSSRILLAALCLLFVAVCGADSPDGPSNPDTTACEGQSSCLATGSIIPLTFLVLFVLILLLWCALHICCNFPCCCSFGACRVPRCSSFFRCFSSTTQQSQVHTHLHAEDVPLTHPILASPAAHLAPLVRPPPSAPHYRPYKGNYRIGKNHHLQPFTLNLHFDYSSTPRTVSGHGVDDGQSFTLSDATFTVDSRGEHRCVFVERFGDGSRYVFYGVWEAGWNVDERWSGFWLRESGAPQQGTFSFQWDEAADEQLTAGQTGGRDGRGRLDGAENERAAGGARKALHSAERTGGAEGGHRRYDGSTTKRTRRAGPRADSH